MKNVYIVFRGNDTGEQELDSVHVDILTARDSVEEILKAAAKEGFIYTVPETVPSFVPTRAIRAWCCRSTYISIENHVVVNSSPPKW
jgi:hypothetical protein